MLFLLSSGDACRAVWTRCGAVAVREPGNPRPYSQSTFQARREARQSVPEIRTKMRLTICDATTAIYEGGPGYKPEHCWNANALLVSTDPVALDQTGWQMIERKRAQMGMKTLAAEERAPSYIVTAADDEHRLGNCDPKRISIVEV